MDDITSLEQLLNGNSTNSTVTSDISGTVTQIIAWIVIPSIIFMVVCLVFFVLYFMRRRKLENAIFEIRDILHDMQQSQASPQANPPTPNVSQPTTASTTLEI